MPRSTTTIEDQKFIADVLSTSLLEDSIQWLQDNLSPEDVFEKSVLTEWAEENGFVQEE